jgi:hypothetical protein
MPVPRAILVLLIGVACGQAVAPNDTRAAPSDQRDKKIAELIKAFGLGRSADSGSDRVPGAEMLEAAIAELTDAITKNPHDADAYFQRGRLHWLANDHGAMADINMAIKLAPRDARAYGVRSCLHAEAGEYSEYQSDTNKAVSLDATWVKRLTVPEQELFLIWDLRSFTNRVRRRDRPPDFESMEALASSTEAKAIAKKILSSDDLGLTARELEFVRNHPNMFYTKVFQDRLALAGERAGVDEVLRNLRPRPSKKRQASIAFGLLDADQRKLLRTISTKVRDHGIGSLNENEKTFVQLYGAEFELP